MTARTRALEPPEVPEEGHPLSVGQVLQAWLDARAVERYERGVERLEPHERLAVVGRIQGRLTYDTLAAALDLRTAKAARSAVTLALLRLAAVMADLEQEDEVRASRVETSPRASRRAADKVRQVTRAS